ncbi:Protein TIC 55, chloroplastic [Glycine max]|nr:Protein TIC 55, chloroplastic [Glycine max]
MSPKTTPNNFARAGFQYVSTIHQLPYDHSILLQNLMDPAHVSISHDRTDWTAKREDAQPLCFEVTERLIGFAGWWGREKEGKNIPNFLSFRAPCVLQNNREIVDKNGETRYFSGVFLCTPTGQGQGKSMLITRFGRTKSLPLANMLPKWYLLQRAIKTHGLWNIGNGWTKWGMVLVCLIILVKTLFHYPQNPSMVEHAPDGIIELLRLLKEALDHSMPLIYSTNILGM